MFGLSIPAGDETAKARIRALGEELDAHRKRVQAQHPGLSLTAMYNVLEKLRVASALRADPPADSAHRADATTALTPKERATHDAGLVCVLRQLHDELDAAVATAYGWVRDGHPETDLPDAEILTRLVALNGTRAAEEATGQIRYLRPEYQTRKAEGGTNKPPWRCRSPFPLPRSEFRVPKRPGPNPSPNASPPPNAPSPPPPNPSPPPNWPNTSSAPNPKTSPKSSKPSPRSAARIGTGRNSATRRRRAAHFSIDARAADNLVCI